MDEHLLRGIRKVVGSYPQINDRLVRAGLSSDDLFTGKSGQNPMLADVEVALNPLLAKLGGAQMNATRSMPRTNINQKRILSSANESNGMFNDTSDEIMRKCVSIIETNSPFAGGSYYPAALHLLKNTESSTDLDKYLRRILHDNTHGDFKPLIEKGIFSVVLDKWDLIPQSAKTPFIKLMQNWIVDMSDEDLSYAVALSKAFKQKGQEFKLLSMELAISSITRDFEKFKGLFKEEDLLTLATELTVFHDSSEEVQRYMWFLATLAVDAPEKIHDPVALFAKISEFIANKDNKRRLGSTWDNALYGFSVIGKNLFPTAKEIPGIVSPYRDDTKTKPATKTNRRSQVGIQQNFKNSDQFFQYYYPILKHLIQIDDVEKAFSSAQSLLSLLSFMRLKNADKYAELVKQFEVFDFIGSIMNYSMFDGATCGILVDLIFELAANKDTKKMFESNNLVQSFTECHSKELSDRHMKPALTKQLLCVAMKLKSD